MSQVVCIDYPRPELENTVNFLEAASLSASFRSAPRPTKPLKVVIAGAGMNFVLILMCFLCLLGNPFSIPFDFFCGFFVPFLYLNF